MVRAHRAPEVLSRADGPRSSQSAGERPGSDHGNTGNRAQLLRFACVGIASTVAFVLLYLALRGMGANLICQFVTAVLNTTVNRRVTFGIRGTADAGRHQVQGLIAFGAGLAVTSAALAILHAVSPRPARVVEVTVLVAATLVATVVRFILYRFWVFRPRQRRN